MVGRLAITESRSSALAQETRATATLAWPLVMTNLAQMAIGTTGTVLLGWLGPEPLAAATLGANVYYIFMILGIGVSAGISPMLAQAIGAGRHVVRDLRRTVRQGLWTAILLTLVSWVVLWFTEDLLLLLGQDARLAAEAGRYMHALQWGMLPFFCFMMLRSFVAARGRPAAAMAVTAIGIVLHAVLAWSLIFGHFGLPALGLTGAGWASTAVETLMFLALVGYIQWDRRFRRHHLFGRFWRADWQRLLELGRVGGPIAAAMLFEVSVFNAAVFLMGWIHVDQLAAHAIAIQVAATTFMVPMGIAQATTVRVGIFAGAGDRPGLRRAGWVGIALGTGFMMASALVLFTTAPLIVRLFLDMSDPASLPVLAYGTSFLVIAGLFQIADGLQVTAASALRGLKDTQVPMLYAGLGYWAIGLPLGAVLGFWTPLEGLGIWIALAFALAIVAVLMLRRWMRRSGPRYD